MDWKLGGLILCAALSGCSTTQVYRNAPSGEAGSVQVLYDAPPRPYESLGVVSAKRYKPGWSDPTVADAIPQLQSAARDLGADAMIVHQSQDSGGTRYIRVEAEAIRFTDKSATQAQPAPSSNCVSCQSIGKH